MARKQIDEVRCKICKGVYPDESDLIDAVYTQKHIGDTQYTEFLGYFCHTCIPASAYIHPTQMVYIVDRMG